MSLRCIFSKLRIIIIFGFLLTLSACDGSQVTSARANKVDTVIFPDGSKYYGDLLDGKPNGQGTRTFPDGRKYVGTFYDWSLDGNGDATWPNGEHYHGHFSNGKLSGYGEFIIPNKVKYLGEFKDDLPNGEGAYYLDDGSKYIGHIVNGQMDGIGTLYSTAGTVVFSGNWHNGKTIAPKISDYASSYTPQTLNGALRENPDKVIKLIRESGTFKVSVLINGVIPLHFLVDSGASDVSIPADVVLTLMRTGTITEADFVGEQTYRLADGSTVKSKTFRIRKLQVGDRVVENVLGSIADVNGSLLLGQSFLSRFKRVSFDYSQGTLVLE